MPNNEIYRGDSLYASFDGYQFCLRAPREHGDHAVYLEPFVLRAFDEYRQAIKHPAIAPPMSDRLERHEEALQRIVQWSEAYPLEVFPEPDWKRAAELLKAGGITLDAISAHCMRHVVTEVGKIAREALE
jgi:hypothetical protein